MRSDQEDFSAIPDDDLMTEIVLIEENMQECGRYSDYTQRNKALHRRLYIEAEKRGIWP